MTDKSNAKQKHTTLSKPLYEDITFAKTPQNKNSQKYIKRGLYDISSESESESKPEPGSGSWSKEFDLDKKADEIQNLT